MREIVLDTETTGMFPDDGDKIVEIGCLELANHIPTGKTLQIYLNPERDIPPEAVAVHGLTREFLKDKPVFSQVYTDLLDFIGDAKLVIHNAEFDMKFLNAELRAVGHPPLQWNRVVDTVTMARQKYPGQPANLDALCRRFGIDNTERTLHGALLDSELLAEVYMELLGGRQHGLLTIGADAAGTRHVAAKIDRPYREPRVFTASKKELAAHAEMLQKLANALWLRKTG
ncbi:MAG: DNA polymerase III subunit epsilon [Alphaproteobacteria bacterium PRO2]|nr:DNA polymerase III subunit epsilon [Alphaproteobacteria bacterium PRO2]